MNTHTTGGSVADAAFTIKMLDEAVAIINALAPEKAPANSFVIHGMSGLKIIKAPCLGNDTIWVSPDLYDVIYRASK